MRRNHKRAMANVTLFSFSQVNAARLNSFNVASEASASPSGGNATTTRTASRMGRTNTAVVSEACLKKGGIDADLHTFLQPLPTVTPASSPAPTTSSTTRAASRRTSNATSIRIATTDRTNRTAVSASHLVCSLHSLHRGEIWCEYFYTSRVIPFEK